MPVIYNSCKIIPAPLVDISKESLTSGDGKKIGVTYTLTLTGKICAYKGSPRSAVDGSISTTGFGGYGNLFWVNSDYPPDETIESDERLGAIIRKQEAINKLFEQDGLLFEIQPLDGSTPLTCNPRIKQINYSQGIWFDYCDYTIVLEADCIEGLIDVDCPDEKISSFDETWSFEQGEHLESFRVTHSLNAVGKRHYEADGSLSADSWVQAKNYVQNYLGLSSGLALFNTNNMGGPTGLTGYNHARSETINTFGGEYSLQETWLLASGNTLETFEVSKNISATEGKTSVSIQGQIDGLSANNVLNNQHIERYNNAAARYTEISSLHYTRALAYAGIGWLNPVALTEVVGHNPKTGVITYNIEYDNRPPNVVDNALSESISVTDNYAADIFASIAVLGRAAGPVLQDINTVTETKRSLSVNITVSPTGTKPFDYAVILAAKPDVTEIIDGVRPSATQVFLTEDTENWEWTTGRYSRNVSWTYQ